MKVLCGLCGIRAVKMSRLEKIDYKLRLEKQCKTSHAIVLCEQCVDENPLMSGEQDNV